MNRFRWTLGALALAFVALSASATGGSAASGASSPRAGAGQPGPEVPALRTRTSRSYKVMEHKYVAQVYPGSIHYRDERGAWQAIDNTLVPAAAGTGFVNRANRYELHAPHGLGRAPIRVAEGNAWVSFALRGGRGLASVAGDTVAYTDALPGVDLTYAAGNDEVKETLVLESRTSPSTFTFTLRTSPGLTPKANRAGGIAFVDANGKVEFAFAPPVMVDSSRTRKGRSRAVATTLAPAPGGYELTVSADRAWLEDPARKWPVKVDPSVLFDPVQDCDIVSDDPDYSWCDWYDLEVMHYDGWGTYRSLLRFPVEDVIPRGSLVQYAELGLYLNWPNDYDIDTHVGVYPVERAWDGWWATWNQYDGINPWTTPGADHEDWAADVQNVRGWWNEWYFWYPRELVQEWVTGMRPNHGMLLKMTDESVNNWLTFSSTKGNPWAEWPYLWVEYVEPGSYGYYTAKNLGMDVTPTPAESGLPACDDDPTWGGYNTYEEADAAADAAADEPDCTTDPTGNVFDVGQGLPFADTPSNGAYYNWVGARTTGSYRGGRITVEVGDPEVNHSGPPEFLNARVFVKNLRQNRWVEAGWAEASWKPWTTATVYSANNPGNPIWWRGKFPVRTGQKLTVRVRRCGTACLKADILWPDKNGKPHWRELHPEQYNLPCGCQVQEYMEEASSIRGRHPAPNATAYGAGVNWFNTMLLTANGWVKWNGSLYQTTTREPTKSAGYPAAYKACFKDRYWNFRTGLITCGSGETPGW